MTSLTRSCRSPWNATWCVPSMSTMPATGAANSQAVRDRALDPAVIQRASVLAARYPVAVRSGQGGYVGAVAGFPSVLGHGKSKAAAVSSTRELLKWAVAYLIDTGRTPTP